MLFRTQGLGEKISEMIAQFAYSDSDVTVVELPGLNHLFQTCTTGSPSEYSGIEETISPTALTMMSDWILERVGR